MPPCLTTLVTRPPSRPHSCAIIASASSDALFCCASKSGGTYSASITGVIGMTLSRRTVPPVSRTMVHAVAMARLARSASARSTGTRIFLNMNASSGRGGYPTRRDAVTGSSGGRVGQRRVLRLVAAAAAQDVGGEIAHRRPGQGRKGQGARDFDRGKAEPRREQALEDPLPHPPPHLPPPPPPQPLLH